HALALLDDDAIEIEGLAEHLAGKLDQSLSTLLLVLPAERGAGAHGADAAIARAEARLEAADQAGDIGALCAVVGVQFIEDEVAECVLLVLLPEELVLRAQQEEVQHLVVGEQYVG